MLHFGVQCQEKIDLQGTIYQVSFDRSACRRSDFESQGWWWFKTAPLMFNTIDHEAQFWTVDDIVPWIYCHLLVLFCTATLLPRYYCHSVAGMYWTSLPRQRIHPHAKVLVKVVRFETYRLPFARARRPHSQENTGKVLVPPPWKQITGSKSFQVHLYRANDAYKAND